MISFCLDMPPYTYSPAGGDDIPSRKLYQYLGQGVRCVASFGPARSGLGVVRIERTAALYAAEQTPRVFVDDNYVGELGSGATMGLFILEAAGSLPASLRTTLTDDEIDATARLSDPRSIELAWAKPFLQISCGHCGRPLKAHLGPPHSFEYLCPVPDRPERGWVVKSAVSGYYAGGGRGVLGLEGAKVYPSEPAALDDPSWQHSGSDARVVYVDFRTGREVSRENRHGN